MKTENEMTRLALDLLRGAVLVAVAFTFIVVLSCFAHGQTPVVPAEVKRAIAVSIQASNKDGIHEEGGIWGTTVDDKLVVIPAKPGLQHPVCSGGIVTLAIGDAADPSLDTNLKTIDGEWHVHPRATKQHDKDHECLFIQPPSDIDLANAMDPVNIVIGARDGIVYFYDTKGIISTIPLKEFLR